MQASATFTLPSNVENLILLTGSAARNGTGNTSDNVMTGNTANNVLSGGGGADYLAGGGGADRLYGGDGADKFVIRSAADSTVASAGRDYIRDFNHAQGDRIDLHTIDANSTVGGDQAFTFIGAAAFGHHAGELRAAPVNGLTLVYGDTNGDAVADFAVLVNPITLVAGDFVL